MKKQQFVSWLSANRPDLEALEIKDLGKKGYFKKELGAAQSFKGFESWQDAHDFLAED